MSDEVIKAIPFQPPDQALFDSLRQFVEAIEHRERVEAWIDWEKEQLYGLGEWAAEHQADVGGAMTDLEKELLRMCRILADGYYNGYADRHLASDEKDACEQAIQRLRKLERGLER